MAAAPPRKQTGALKMRLVNGKICLDEDSRTIRSADFVDEELDGPEITESESTQYTNAHTYLSAAKKRKPMPWKAEHTTEFYELITRWGTNFEVIARAMPGRTRRDIKLKFNKEDKLNPARMTKALRGSTAVTIEQVDELLAKPLDDCLTPEQKKEQAEALAAKMEKERERQERAAKRKHAAENMTEEQIYQNQLKRRNASDRAEKRRNREAMMGEEIVEDID